LTDLGFKNLQYIWFKYREVNVEHVGGPSQACRAEQDVFPPEREEEVEVRRVDGAGAVDSRQGHGDPGDGRSNRSPVSRDGLMLLLASELHLRAAPGRSTRGASLHDERHAFPQAVEIGAAELVSAVEAVLDGGPVGTELEEDGAAAGGLEK
jgi:hypothetical protein